jgi:DNA polymerase III epsilon subunit-like protein
MTILLFHTLQADKHDFRERHAHPKQPPLLAIAAGLYDDGKLLRRMLRVVDLGEYPIPTEIAEFHGITYEMMCDDGARRRDVLEEFGSISTGVEMAYAFSVDHHAAVLNQALVAEDMTMIRPPLGCLMRKSVNVCKIPDRRGNYKFPSLAEAYRFYTGQSLPTSWGNDSAGVLTKHLDIREVIWRGIEAHAQAELDKASAPIRPPFVRTEWE